MRRVGMGLLMAVLVAGSNTGCTKPLEKQILRLQDQNRSLKNNLGQCEGALASLRSNRDDCETQLASVRQEADRLRSDLANMPEPQAQPQPAVELAAPGWTSVPGGAMIALESGILFPPGKVTLRPEAKSALDAVVSALRGEYASKDVLVFGHTDNQPIKKSGWEDNYELSAQRALSVARYLDKQGISPGRLIASGCGEHRPRASNSSASGRASNRRVEIYAIDLAALKL